MMERFTSNEKSQGLRAAVLGGILLWGSQRISTNPHNYKPDLQSDDVVDVSQGTPPLNDARDNFRELLRVFLSTELSPQDQADICLEALKDAQAIDPMEDPVAYLEEIRAYEECKADLNQQARSLLYAADTEYLSVRDHLMRCQPNGEIFSLKQLEKCEDLEQVWVEGFSDELASRGIELIPTYRDDFNFLPEQGVWEKPGYYFEVDRFDGAQRISYNFAIHFHGQTNFIIEPVYTDYEEDEEHDFSFISGSNVGTVGGDFISEYEKMTRGPAEETDLEE